MSIISTITSSIAAICAFLALRFNIKTYKTEKLYSQAKLISIWSDPKTRTLSTYKIMNSSEQPVYNVIAFQHFNNNKLDNAKEAISYITQKQLFTKFIEILPPDSTTIEMPFHGASAGNGHDVPAILFTDASNIQWYRRADGHLQQENYVDDAMHAGLILKHV